MNYYIPIPSYHEQMRISIILNKQCALIDKAIDATASQSWLFCLLQLNSNNENDKRQIDLSWQGKKLAEKTKQKQDRPCDTLIGVQGLFYAWLYWYLRR